MALSTTKRLILKVWQTQYHNTIEARQGDAGSLFFDVSFSADDGTIVELPKTASPRMEFKKPDGKIVMIDGVFDTAKENAFIIELSPQCFTAAGRAVIDFMVSEKVEGTEESKVIVGAQVIMQIGAAAVEASEIISTDDFQTLENALNNVAAADETSKEALTRATEVLDTLTESVKTATSAADSALGNATLAANAASAAATSTEKAEASEAASQKYAQTAEAAAKRAEEEANSMDGVGVHRYGVLFDGVHAAGTRMYNAVDMVANVHKGSFNTALVNDFDNVYPWSERKLCNWTQGTATEKAKITAFEGEPGFDLNGNIGVYTPELWYKVEVQTDGKRLCVIADGKLPGYIYNPPYMLTPMPAQDDGNGGLVCKVGGTQAYNVALNTYNTKNAAQGTLTEDYWADGIEKLLISVEFATMNSQTALGQGFVSARYNNSDVPAFAENGANRVILAKATAEQYIPGEQTIGIGTSWFGGFKAYYRKVLSVTPYENNAAYSCVNFDGEPVDILTTDHVGSMSAIYTNPLGNKSGYIGTDGKAVTYYRGAAVQTGAWMWIANIMRNNDEKLYVAPTDTPQTGAIGADWVDTGITLPSAEGYIKTIGVSDVCPLIQQPIAVGGDSGNPVGDYFYRPAVGTAPTALLSRGVLYGSTAGAWSDRWWYAPASANWLGAARSLIRNPFGGVGVETPTRPD